MRARESRAFEAHLAECSRCAAEVADVRHVIERAREMTTASEPASDLWPGIAGRLPERTPKRERIPRLAVRLRLARPQWAAVAAAMLVCVSVLAFLQLRHRPEPGGKSTTAPPANIALPSREAGNFVEAHDPEYEMTVANLQREAQARLTPDPKLVEVLDENIAALDAAIANYREALAERPGDQHLLERLESARQRKLEVLQQAVSLAETSPN